jgi:hypothetical protein
MALSKEAREFFAKEGSKGGKATAKKRTAQERSEAARKAVTARWQKTLDKLEAKIDATSWTKKTKDKKSKKDKLK